MSSLSLLQQIFLTQELNRGLLHCRQILYQLTYKGTIISFLVIKGQQVPREWRFPHISTIYSSAKLLLNQLNPTLLSSL